MIDVIVNVRDAVFAALVAWTGVGDSDPAKPTKDQMIRGKPAAVPFFRRRAAPPAGESSRRAFTKNTALACGRVSPGPSQRGTGPANCHRCVGRPDRFPGNDIPEPMPRLLAGACSPQ